MARVLALPETGWRKESATSAKRGSLRPRSTVQVARCVPQESSKTLRARNLVMLAQLVRKRQAPDTPIARCAKLACTQETPAPRNVWSARQTPSVVLLVRLVARSARVARPAELEVTPVKAVAMTLRVLQHVPPEGSPMGVIASRARKANSPAPLEAMSATAARRELTSRLLARLSALVARPESPPPTPLAWTVA